MSAVALPVVEIPTERWFDDYQPGEGWVSFAEAQGHDHQHVWTIVEADGALAALAGFRYVNRTGDYAITKRPWVTGGEEVILFCGCEVEFGACELCMPPLD